jgi:probable selenium-dependent hydroxylase accessory protein YqeC
MLPGQPLAALLVDLVPGGGILALVGGGGKTTTLFALARDLAGMGRPVLVTTTTHIMDPRPAATVRLDPSLAEAGDTPSKQRLSGSPERPGPEMKGMGGDEGDGHVESPALAGQGTDTDGQGTARRDLGPPGTEVPGPDQGWPRVVASALDPATGRLAGIHPARARSLVPAGGYLLVEADGSRRLPVKAPAPWEPVVPPGADPVIGLVGLDALGAPMDERTVHRPALFQSLTGCAPGEAIALDHLRALAREPDGLFKGAPARKVLILNKADLLPEGRWPEVLAAFREVPGLAWVLLGIRGRVAAAWRRP